MCMQIIYLRCIWVCVFVAEGGGDTCVYRSRYTLKNGDGKIQRQETDLQAPQSLKGQRWPEGGANQ